MPNRLINARSPYLRKAAHQPVDWYEWGQEAFEKAQREDKPILLSIGGVWCHWCHVMAHESFENEEVAHLINDLCVPIKIDRDERPDIDRRYQDVVVRLSGSGGWPLTVFLTPNGKAFYGGTYFPPEDRWQKPGLKTILVKLVDLYKKERWRIDTIAEELFRHTLSSASAEMTEEIEATLLEKNVSSLLSALDFQNGGFGTAPKFHHASAFEFLINITYFANNDAVRKGVEISLDAMAKGGVYDHLLGGFFRYSTDEKWIVPHFEKMLYDNAELLKLYCLAYRVFDKPLYKYISEGIIEYYKKYGIDAKGGFYASQDADIGVLDEGGYYTFSLDEVSSFLTEDESQVIGLYFDIQREGEIHHAPSKNVLFVRKEPIEIAGILHMPFEEVQAHIGSAKAKMVRFREDTRELPFIDTTIYTNWNGLMIEAMCVAGRLLGNAEYSEIAERAARRILGDYCSNGTLRHTEGIDGFSEDYIFFSKGLIELFQATQNEAYLKTAKALMDMAIGLFWDPDNGGFFDSTAKEEGYLQVNVKNIQDSPVQSANGIAPYVLLALGALTRDMKYGGYAEKGLKAFASLLGEYPSASHSYFISLLAYTKGIYKVETSRFFNEAFKSFRPHKFVIKKDVPGVIVCEKNTCRMSDTYPPGGQGE